MNKRNAIALLLAATLTPILTSSTVFAADEVIVIVGEPIPDACEDAWGPGYSEVLGPQNQLIGCACTTPLFCNDSVFAPADPPGGGGGGGGGGGDGGDDGGDDDDAMCTCEAEEPPEVCEISCEECGHELDECLAQTDEDRNSCKDDNKGLAIFLCKGDTGNYATVDDCVAASLNGFPGIGTTTGRGTKSGWTVTARGLITKLGNSVGLDVSYNSQSFTRQSQTITYPPIPIDLEIYPSCKRAAAEDYQSCQAGARECNESVADQFGDICEES